MPGTPGLEGIGRFRAIFLISKEKAAPIYTTYGSIYTTFGLGVRHTGRPGRPARPGFSAGVLRR